MDLEQTIAALASPPGPSARGIVRITGPDVAKVVAGGFRVPSGILISSSRPQRDVGHWLVSDSPVRIPCELWYWPTVRSYSGQPTAELHLPGSPPLVEHVLQDVYRRGVRPARPGEFTLRAFLAGKMDLLQAEAVLGVIDACQHAELQTALDQLAGGISSRFAELRRDLLDVLADLEAGLDFVDEDIEFVSRSDLLSRVETARQFLESMIDQASSRMTSRTVPKVVLAGLPNAGKSTLFNRLAEKSLALISPQAGTTRDYLRTELSWNGVRFELIDTAGYDDDSSGIEELAQGQRSDQFQRANLIVWCSSSDQTPPQLLLDEAALSEMKTTAIPLLRLWTKCDRETSMPHRYDTNISAHTGFGLIEFQQRLSKLLTEENIRSTAWLGMTAARCQESLEQASAALKRAEGTARDLDAGDELLAIDLREALDHLGHIVGAVYTDDLLDRIFSKFCIGK